MSGLIQAIGLVGDPTHAYTNNVLVQGNILAGGEIIVRTDCATEVTIQNNSFVPGPNYNNYWAPFQTTSFTHIENNQFSLAIVDGRGVVPKGFFYGNRYTNGAVLPFLLDNFIP